MGFRHTDTNLFHSSLVRETITASFNTLSADQILAEVVHTFGAHYVRQGRRISIRAGEFSGRR